MTAHVPPLALLVFTLAYGCTVETLVPGSAEPPADRRDDAASTGSSAPSNPTAPGAARDAGTGEGDAAAESSAEVNLRATGDCAPEFRDLVVATNTSSYDSVGVSNALSPMNGSFQLALPSGRRSFTLSTDDRAEEGDVINVIAGGVVYTNHCDTPTCTYDPKATSWRNDPIAGTVRVSAYEPRQGTLDVTLSGVVLQAAQGRGLCRLDGTVKATRLGR